MIDVVTKKAIQSWLLDSSLSTKVYTLANPCVV